MEENKLIIGKNRYNKFIWVYFAISMILLFFCMVIVIYVDPFYHYHAAMGKLIQENEAYQNVGIARNEKYDALLTGSSMTENFRVSQINDIFHCNTVKLSFSGGRVPNYEILFEQMEKNRNIRVNQVFYGCDIFAYIDDPDKEADNKIPEYLYDDSLASDVNYWFNKKVIRDYVLRYIYYDFTNETPDNDEAYNWSKNYIFEKSFALKNYIRPQIQEEKNEDFYEYNVKKNCEKIGKYILENPEIEFNIFFPPYSILFYDYYNREGNLKALIKAQEDLTKYLLEFPNVKLSSFMTEENIICNLDNYKDYSHYSEEINEYILKEIKNESKLLKKDNYNEYFEKARNFFTSYNYNEIFQ